MADEDVATFMSLCPGATREQARDLVGQYGGDAETAAAIFLSSQSVPPPSSKQAKTTSNSSVKTFSDLQASSSGGGSGSGKQNDYYAGGASSGLAVRGANDMYKRLQEAQQSGAAAGTPSDEHFKISLHLYDNGFVIRRQDEEGPFRSLDDPSNQVFMEKVQRGDVPDEVRELVPPNTPAERVELKVVRENKPYEPPKKKIVPFSGSGNKLGSTPSPAMAAATVGSAGAAGAAETKEVADKPAAVVAGDGEVLVKVRLSGGKSVTVAVDGNASIAALYGAVRAHPDNTKGEFDLWQTYPRKKVDQASDEKAEIFSGEMLVQR